MSILLLIGSIALLVASYFSLGLLTLKVGLRLLRGTLSEPDEPFDYGVFVVLWPFVWVFGGAVAFIWAIGLVLKRWIGR